MIHNKPLYLAMGKVWTVVTDRVEIIESELRR